MPLHVRYLSALNQCMSRERPGQQFSLRHTISFGSKWRLPSRESGVVESKTPEGFDPQIVVDREVTGSDLVSLLVGPPSCRTSSLRILHFIAIPDLGGYSTSRNSAPKCRNVVRSHNLVIYVTARCGLPKRKYAHPEDDFFATVSKSEAMKECACTGNEPAGSKARRPPDAFSRYRGTGPSPGVIDGWQWA